MRFRNIKDWVVKHPARFRTLTGWYQLGAATITTLQSKLYQGALDGLGQLYWGRLVSGSAQLLSGALVIVALHFKSALTAPALAVLTVSVLQMAGLRHVLMAVAKGRLRLGRARRQIPLRRLWKVAVPFGVVNSAAYLVSIIQVPLLGSILGAEVIAPFYLAQRIGQIGTNVIHQFLLPQIPLFTQQIAANDWNTACHRMRRILLVAGLGALGCFALYYLLSPRMVELWVGPGRYVPDRVLAVMAVDYCFLTVTVGFAQFVLASGHNPFVTTTVIAGLLNLVGCFFLSETHGALGIAFSSLVAGVATNYWYATWQWILLLRRLGKWTVKKDVPNS